MVYTSIFLYTIPTTIIVGLRFDCQFLLQEYKIITSITATLEFPTDSDSSHFYYSRRLLLGAWSTWLRYLNIDHNHDGSTNDSFSNIDRDSCQVLCSDFALRNTVHKLQLFAEARKYYSRTYLAAILLKKLSYLKFALFRFKSLVVLRKRLPSLIATYYDDDAYNRYCNRAKRWVFLKLCRSFHKQRICSTICKWRYSLLHNFISVWLQRTRFNVHLKRLNLNLVSRYGPGFLFAAFRNRLSRRRCRRFVLETGKVFHRHYSLRCCIIHWRASKSFSRSSRFFLRSIGDDALEVKSAKKRLLNHWKVQRRLLQERVCRNQQREQKAVTHHGFWLQRVAMLRWLRRLTARYRHHAVIKPAVSRYLLCEGRQRRLSGLLRSWELLWQFRKQFVRIKYRQAIQHHSLRSISNRWPTFRKTVLERQRQVRASLRAEFHYTCTRYSKGLQALKVLLSHPSIANEGVEGRRWLSMRGRLRATLFWKAWRCSKCLAIWCAMCLHFRLRREQQRAAWTEFGRETARSACRAAVRIATIKEVGVISERSAVLRNVLIQWKNMVFENKLVRYSSRDDKETVYKVGSVCRTGVSIPQRILFQRDAGEGCQNHNQSILGSREQPRRSLPPLLPLPALQRESPYDPTISSRYSSSLREEAFDRWKLPPRPLHRDHIAAAPGAEDNRSYSLQTFQPTHADTNSEIEHMRSSSEDTVISGGNDSELRKQLAREVLVLLQEISRCI